MDENELKGLLEDIARSQRETMAATRAIADYLTWHKQRIEWQDAEMARRARQAAPVEFTSGQWKRRPGDRLYATPAPEHHSGPLGVSLDPWVRKDVPAVEPARGQTGEVDQEETTDGEETYKQQLG